MWKEILGGFLEWVKANKEVKMRTLDIQKEGLLLQDRQVRIQEQNGELDRQEKMLRITIAKSDLAARHISAHPPQPLTAVPDQPERPEDPCQCDKPDGEAPVEMTELETLKAEATKLNIAFRSNVTAPTLKKKIATFKKNSAAVTADPSDDECAGTPPPANDAIEKDPGKDYSGEEIRCYCRAHMATQESIKGDNGRGATKAFLKELTGFETPSEMEKQDNTQELFNKVAAACIELGLTIPNEEEEEI